MSGQARVTLSDEDYLDIEDALGSSARGRAFLRMRDQRLRVVAIDEVRRMTMSMRDWTVSRMQKAGGEAQVNVLRRELQEMSAYIQKTRSEIAAMRVRDEKDGAAGSSRINMATGELDAIVSSTERATSDILAAAERIFALASDLPAELEHVGGEITSHATDIMTHCSFQDLTGQRITKVVNTLRYLEQRVSAMVEIWGVDDQTKAAAGPTDERPDAHLLNGPSRPGEGRTQDEIDQLLAGTLGPGAAAAVNGSPAPAAAPVAAAKPAPAPASAPASANVGQADIDKLFA